jgi:pimeloyl-ACP methyl ester carboxylesterase
MSLRGADCARLLIRATKRGGAYPGEIFDVVFDGVSCPGQHHRWPQHRWWGQDQFIDEDDYRSWLDYLAGGGFDVYFVDVRGYGRSTKPPEMGQPAGENPPLVSTEIALRDVESAVDFILQRRKIPRLQLIGWSWGTVLAGSYAAQHPERVERLVLHAPYWTRRSPPLVQESGPLGAYRTVTREQALQNWLGSVPDLVIGTGEGWEFLWNNAAGSQKADVIPCGWFERVADRVWVTDREGAKANPPVLRVPNGALLDDRTYWSAGKSLYDPSRITAPVLLIRGEWDRETPAYMAQDLFGLLVGAPYKRSVTIREGSHMLMVEKSRVQLFREVYRFLEDASLGRH